MQKDSLIQDVKKKLEEEKAVIEKELQKFAKKDEQTKGDWDTLFPQYGTTESGSGALEKAADEMQEYGNLLPIEHSLESKLREIEAALNRIADNKYGKCEQCGKEIEKARLEVYPEARFCIKCKE